MASFDAPIEKLVFFYVVGIETWFPEVAETWMSTDARQKIQDRMAELSSSQRARVAAADNMVRALADKHRGATIENDPHGDVLDLERIVELLDQSERSS